MWPEWLARPAGIMGPVTTTSESPADRLVALPGGRRIALVEHGDPEGRAVFVFHGTPASRLRIRSAFSTACDQSRSPSVAICARAASIDA